MTDEQATIEQHAVRFTVLSGEAMYYPDWAPLDKGEGHNIQAGEGVTALLTLIDGGKGIKPLVVGSASTIGHKRPGTIRLDNPTPYELDVTVYLEYEPWAHDGDQLEQVYFKLAPGQDMEADITDSNAVTILVGGARSPE